MKTKALFNFVFRGLQSLKLWLRGSSPLFRPNGQAPVRNTVTAMSLIDSCQILSTRLILVVILPSVKTCDLWPLGFQQALGLYGNPQIDFNALAQDRALTHCSADREYRSLQIPPTGVNAGLGGKTSWSSASPLYAYICHVGVVQRWKNPISQYNPPSFLPCRACNRDIS